MLGTSGERCARAASRRSASSWGRAESASGGCWPWASWQRPRGCPTWNSPFRLAKLNTAAPRQGRNAWSWETAGFQHDLFEPLQVKGRDLHQGLDSENITDPVPVEALFLVTRGLGFIQPGGRPVAIVENLAEGDGAFRSGVLFLTLLFAPERSLDAPHRPDSGATRLWRQSPGKQLGSGAGKAPPWQCLSGHGIAWRRVWPQA